MKHLIKRRLSLLLITTILFSMIQPAFFAGVSAEVINHFDFEKYSAEEYSEKEKKEFITTATNGYDGVVIGVEDDGNQYLKMSGTSEAADGIFVTSVTLPEGISAITMRVKFIKGHNQQVVLRGGGTSNTIIFSNVDNKVRVLHDGSKVFDLKEDSWYSVFTVVDVDNKTIEQSVTCEATGETKSGVKTYTSDNDKKNVQAKGAIRFLTNLNVLAIDDLRLWTPPVVTFADDERLLSVKPQLNFTTDSEMPIKPEHILLNGKSGLIEAVTGGNGSYTAVVGTPLEKNTEYTITLDGYTDEYGAESYDFSGSFKTHNTGLTLKSDGGVWKVKNELSGTETAVVAGMKYDGEKMSGWDFERVSLAGGESMSFSYPDADVVVLMNNLTDAVPFDLININAKNKGGNFDSVITAEYDENSGVLSGGGKISGKNAGFVVKSVASDSTVKLDEDSKEAVLEAIEYLYAGEADNNGCYSFSFLFDKVSGRRDISVASAYEKDTAEGIALVNTKDAENLCNELAKAKSGTEVGTILKKYAIALTSEFALLNEMTDKGFIYESIYLIINSGKTYSGAAGIVADMEASAVLYNALKAEADGALELLGTYSDKIGIDAMPAVKLWTDADKAAKAEITEELKAEGVEDSGSYIKKLQQKLILRRVKAATKYDEVKTYIESFYEILEISMSDYNDLGAPSYVAKNMVGKGYDIDSFKKAFYDYIEEYEESEEDKKESSSSSGKGSGFDYNSAPATGTELAPVEKVETTQVGFNDLATVSWAREAIESLAKRKIVSGYADGGFKPNKSITREEFVKLLVDFFGFTDSSAKSSFTDVKDGAWYYSFVASAEKNALVNGIGNGMFGVGRVVTRQDMAVMLYNAAKKAGIELSGDKEVSFSDSDKIASYANEAVYALAGCGIVNGMDGRFEPTQECTRAQAAVMLYGIDVYKNGGEAPKEESVTFDENKLGLLNALGLMIGKNEPEKVMTRAEFAHEAAVLVGMSKNAPVSAGYNGYTDVDQSTAYSGDIDYLKKMNAMGGFSDGGFMPNGAMSGKNAVAVIGRLMGYGREFSNEEDIYQAAVKRGLPMLSDTALTNEAAVALLYEALHTSGIQGGMIGSHPIESSGRTLMEVVFDAHRSDGIIDATPISGLDRVQGSGEGRISIDNTLYYSDSFYEYLGYNVRFYYINENDTHPRVLWAYPRNNEITRVKSEDITSFKDGVLTYEEKEKVKTVKVPASADVIYNGEAYPGYDDSMVEAVSGSITVVESDNHTVMFLEDYTAGVFERISPDGEKLYFETGSAFKLSDAEFVSVENASGVCTLADLKKGDIVAVMESKSKNVIKLVASDEAFGGVVEALDDDTIIIDSVEYIISKDFATGRAIFVLGSEVTVYTDFAGKIVNAKKGVSGVGNFGYLIYARMTEEDETKPLVKLLTEENDLLTIRGAEKMVIDGSGKEGQNAIDALKGNQKTEAQLIRYKLNKDNELSWVETAQNRDDYNDYVSYSDKREGLFIDITSGSSTHQYKSGANTFDGKCMLDASTKVFCVMTGDEEYSSDNYYAGGIGVLNNDKNYKYMSYRTSGASICAEAVVVFDDDGLSVLSGSTPNTIAVVTKITEGVDSDNTKTTYVHILKQNKELAVELAKDAEIFGATESDKTYTDSDGKKHNYELGVGDAIRYAVNNKGQLVKARIEVDASRNVFTHATNPNDNNYGGSQLQMIYYPVYDFRDDVLKLVKADPAGNIKWSDFAMYRGFTTIPVYYVEEVDGRRYVRMGTADDVISYTEDANNYSYALVTSRMGSTLSMVIYQKERNN